MSDWIDVHALLPGLRGERLHVLPASQEARVRRALEGAGFTLRTLEGSRACDEAGFFAEIARALELPTHFGRNWDALHDALGALGERAERRLALVWRDAHLSLAGDLQTLLSACLALEAAASASPYETDARLPQQLVLVLLGEGSGFGAPEPER